MEPEHPNLAELEFKFHHVHMYVDGLKEIDEYKQIENALSSLAEQGSFDPFTGGMRFMQANALPERVAEGRSAWKKIISGNLEDIDPENYNPSGQDLVEQLIVGLGWRTTAEYVGKSTRSILLTSMDPLGVKFVLTCKHANSDNANETEVYDHFDARHMDRFSKCHAGRQGISTLAFEVGQGEVDSILENYRTKHPDLVVPAFREPGSNDAKRAKSSLSKLYVDKRTVVQAGVEKEIVMGSMRIGEVFAYYKTGDNGERIPDQGTVLRFVERSGNFASRPGFGNPEGVLPGLVDVPAKFDGTTIPAYSDHWVSNVFNREEFMATLKDTLGFTPKVNFNAGVIAAGRARIESTVIGNAAKTSMTRAIEVLKNQSQVYLPTNNSLSEVGHVHGFLQEYGQGIQHLASRVSDLVAFIERVNNYRAITGRGFTFLRIPRSYYGYLTTEALVKNGCSEGLASAVFACLESKGLVTSTGVVNMNITRAEVSITCLDGSFPSALAQEFAANASNIADTVCKARYNNLYSLLKDNLDEQGYLQIVQNKVLVDIQGGDILYQIFTANVLQRKTGEEAPFLEFIQRVCGECRGKDGSEICKPMKPGCGGFGIRNFLTLFLSIEVSKAMLAEEEARKIGDAAGAKVASEKVRLFTRQLDLSNPVLTSISDAMTEEGDLKDLGADMPGASAELQQKLKAAQEQKMAGQKRLQEISLEYAQLMQNLEPS